MMEALAVPVAYYTLNWLSGCAHICTPNCPSGVSWPHHNNMHAGFALALLFSILAGLVVLVWHARPARNTTLLMLAKPPPLLNLYAQAVMCAVLGPQRKAAPISKLQVSCDACISSVAYPM